MHSHYLIPQWPAPSSVKTRVTTRQNGNSAAPFNEFNLAAHVSDLEEAVKANRLQLQTELRFKNPIQFLTQIHGTEVINYDQPIENLTADACYTTQKNQACAVLTADCLPLLICNEAGTEIAAIHAGWRGLLSGVIDTTLKEFKSSPAELLAWLGPALGPCHLQLNEAIQTDYLQADPNFFPAFETRNDEVFADFHKLAQINLQRLGVTQIYHENTCTYCDKELFYSHRQDQGTTGRFASLIWIE